MGASQQTKTEDSTSTRTPYGPAMGNIQNILDSGYNLFNAGVGAGAYQGDRVAGLGGRSQAGLDDLYTNRNAGQGAAQAGNSYLQGLLGNGGQTAGGQQATQGLLGVGPASTSGLQAAANASTGFNPVSYGTASISPVSTAGLSGVNSGASTAGLSRVNPNVSTAGLSRINPSVSTTGLQGAARELSNGNSLYATAAR